VGGRGGTTGVGGSSGIDDDDDDDDDEESMEGGGRTSGDIDERLSHEEVDEADGADIGIHRRWRSEGDNVFFSEG